MQPLYQLLPKVLLLAPVSPASSYRASLGLPLRYMAHKGPIISYPCSVAPSARIHRVLVQGNVRAAVQVPGARGPSISSSLSFYS